MKRYIAIDGKLCLLTFTEINTLAVTVASTLTLTLIKTNTNLDIFRFSQDSYPQMLKPCELWNKRIALMLKIFLLTEKFDLAFIGLFKVFNKYLIPTPFVMKRGIDFFLYIYIYKFFPLF